MRQWNGDYRNLDVETYGAISDTIICRLKRGPATRDELLNEVYGNAPKTPKDERMALNRTISNLRNLHGFEIRYGAGKYILTGE